MSDTEFDREISEMLAMLKAIERKMADGTMPFDKDIFTVHLAVLHGTYDMSEALEFIMQMYKCKE